MPRSGPRPKSDTKTKTKTKASTSTSTSMSTSTSTSMSTSMSKQKKAAAKGKVKVKVKREPLGRGNQSSTGSSPRPNRQPRKEGRRGSPSRKEERSRPALNFSNRSFPRRIGRGNDSVSGVPSLFGPLTATAFPPNFRDSFSNATLSPQHFNGRSSQKRQMHTAAVAAGSDASQRNNSNNPSHKRKRDKFELKLPSTSQSRLVTEMPWNECVDEYSNDSSRYHHLTANPNPRAVDSLASFSSMALDRLNAELNAFAAYVRLRPPEFEARHYLMEYLTETCQEVYKTSSHAPVVQCFGSFATPQVCCFQSDVDVCLWGVVASAENNPDSLTSNNNNNNNNNNNLDTDDSNERLLFDVDFTPKKQSIAATTKKQKVDRWKQVLQEQDQEEKKQDSAEHGKDAQHKGNEEAIRNAQLTTATTTTIRTKKNQVIQFQIDREGVQQLGGEDDFFVIDRRGDQQEEQKEISGNTDQPESIAVEEQGQDCSQEPAQEAALKANAATLSAQAFPSTDNDDKQEQEIISIDDSDDDSADKLENFRDNATVRGRASFDTSADDVYVIDSDSSDEEQRRPRKRPRLMTNDKQKSSSDEKASMDNEGRSGGLEVSFHTVQPAKRNSGTYCKTSWEEAEDRKKIVRALRSLGNKLRSGRMLTNVEVRARAKVPIICMETKFGFEGDVAIGGHNGADTSHFAAAQVAKYKSFATVVLFLKILLYQQDLDKPFTGGLGSFKLYVLVAYHLEKHLAMGGRDHAGEVLVSLFCRFGTGKSSAHTSRSKTHLSRDGTLSCSGGKADFAPCSRLDFCVELFEAGWKRLSERLTSMKDESSISCLADLIRHQGLQQRRSYSLQFASNWKSYEMPARVKGTHHIFKSDGTIIEKKRVRLDYNAASIKRQTGAQTRTNGTSAKKVPAAAVAACRPPVEADEETLLRGYSVRRDANGTLIPLIPLPHHAEAKLQDKNSAFNVKNRKNKKKQHRDKGKQAIARDLAGNGLHF